jgi:hypothetical protein
MKTFRLDSRDIKALMARFIHHIVIGFLMAICLILTYLLYPIQEMPSTAHKVVFGGVMLIFAGIILYNLFRALQTLIFIILGKKEVREGVVESYSRTISEGKTAAEFFQMDGKEYKFGRGTSVHLDYPTDRVSDSEIPSWILQKGDRVKIHLIREDIIIRIEKL